ncbi:MAG TPA: c-type cytochrome [Burkholderiales bacterium]|nr:c-type cytochrome [Burkholderiales bacterium]
MIRFFALAIAFGFVASAHAAGDAAKGQEIVGKVCAACHGFDGIAAIPANPSLAGQHADYIYKQLTEFKSGARANPVMAGMVANLSPDDMRNVAAFYSSQAPRAMGAKDKDLAARGAKLYRGGNAANGVAACAGCHSPNGAGIPALYPRLASQHADYVAAQLKSFRAGDRANDPNLMMRSTAARLSDKDIAALAEYISGLH